MNQVKEVLFKQKQGIAEGVCSVCSANAYVVRACAREIAGRENGFLLVEATANQVNQDGGYTGMRPADFRDFVFRIAEEEHLDRSRIALGGDHLGPLAWKSEDENSAMAKASDLIRAYMEAGFTKIHIDTSMRLGSDDPDGILSDETIAARSASLARTALETHRRMKRGNSAAALPVFVVGSEVPIPGGETSKSGGAGAAGQALGAGAPGALRTTDPEDLKKTLSVFEKTYRDAGLDEIWDNVVAVVVQPGVEFGDDTIHDYDREKARSLSAMIKSSPNLMFEGHSTDYQTPGRLREMVEDGVGILKVGPQLTFALRESIFALEEIEKRNPRIPERELSNFSSKLDQAMLSNPKNWKGYFSGDERSLAFARAFSLSDRTRYYIGGKEVQASLRVLVSNLAKHGMPQSLLSQYCPFEARAIRSGQLERDPEEILLSAIRRVYRDYLFATLP